MLNTDTINGAPGNQILDRLPMDESERLLTSLEPAHLEFKQLLYEANSPIDFVYFPKRGIVSGLALMDDGGAIEVTAVGREGVVGLPALYGPGNSFCRTIVQAPGEALRMPAAEFRDEVGHEGPLRELVHLYQSVFLKQLAQSAACHGLHTVLQRCCRWLLVTQDRMLSPELELTHEFLAMALGVRRPSVTEVLGLLQSRGLISAGRGRIIVRDRMGLEAASCECYRAVVLEFDRVLTTSG